MAFCPECNASLPATAVSCNACGYDFAPPETAQPNRGWEYSEPAEVTLMVGAFCSGMAAIILGYIAVIELVQSHYKNSFFSLLSATITCALCVVFLRVRK